MSATTNRAKGCMKAFGVSILIRRELQAHHGEVLQHVSVHSSVIKLVFVLGKADIIEPTFETQNVTVFT